MIENNPEIERHRVTNGKAGSDASYGNNGLFIVRWGRAALKVLASTNSGWEHVSISVYRKKRTPTWDEMCYIKDLFWGKEECVIQYHPPLSEYVNMHEYVLHLWKPIGVELPLPPSSLVGWVKKEDR
jgi:hypothetical protein